MSDTHIVISIFIIIVQRSIVLILQLMKETQILNKSFNVSKLKCEPRSISPQITDVHTRFGGYF